MTSQNIDLSAWDTLYSDDGRMIKDDTAVGVIRIGRESPYTRKKPALSMLCTTQFHMT
jgi:hypothetical protein